MVASEGMALGLPVVATTAGGLAEQVLDGITGRLIPPGDEEAMVTALEELLSDEGKRRSMGAAGRARVLETFDPERSLDALASTYDALIPRPGR
jgi:glycosyltransferase involved in cell wall biosynthesis